MGCIFPENKLGVLQVGGREWRAAGWEENTPGFPYFFFFGGVGVMWVWEWVAGFGIRGPTPPCLRHRSPAAWQTGQQPLCSPHFLQVGKLSQGQPCSGTSLGLP